MEFELQCRIGYPRGIDRSKMIEAPNASAWPRVASLIVAHKRRLKGFFSRRRPTHFIFSKSPSPKTDSARIPQGVRRTSLPPVFDGHSEEASWTKGTPGQNLAIDLSFGGCMLRFSGWCVPPAELMQILGSILGQQTENARQLLETVSSRHTCRYRLHNPLQPEP